MDFCCKNMLGAVEMDATDPRRMLWNWQEKKEIKKLGPQEGVLLLEWLKKKYVGFKLNENERNY